MNYFIGFDPYTIRQHNRQMRMETDSLRLQGQLRKNRKVRRSSRLFAVIEQIARPGDPVSPEHGLRTTSSDSLVQTSQACEDRTSWPPR
jgi:hypothetical protein